MIRRTRTPLFLQMEAAECGAACLAMVLAHHGRWLTLEEVRHRCGTSRDGLTAASIQEAATHYGLDAHVFRREPETITDLPMPQIIHWCFNHFVVLERVRGGNFHIVDPAQGRMVVSRAQFGRCFTGLTLAFEPGPDFVKAGTKPSVVGALVAEARRSPDAMVTAFCSGVLHVIPGVALAGATSVFIDRIMAGGQVDWIPYLLVVLGLLIMAKGLLSWIGAIAEATLKIKIGASSAVRGFWRALRLPIGFYAQRSAGEVVSRIRLGSEVGSTIAGPLASLLPSVVMASIYILILWFYDAVVAGAAAAAAAVNLFVLWALARRLADRNREHQVAEGRAAGAATSALSSLAAYRLLGRERLLVSRWAAIEDTAIDTEQRLGWLRAIASLGPVSTGLLMAAIVLVVGAVRAMDGTLTLGGLVAAQVLAGLLNAPIAAIASSLCQLQEAAGALMRLADLERHPVANAYRDAQRSPLPDVAPGRLTLADVSFSYVPGRPLLHGVDLTIEPGRLVALLGPSGAGKSTLARLAAGILDPDGGTVALDGVALADIPPHLLRQRLVYLGQTPAVFTGTIEENVRLWSPRFAAQDIYGAVNLAGLGDSVLRRAGGLSAKLTAGAHGLSGGEQQRLALARALVRRPHIVVLDEPTSALDPSSEETVLEMLRASGVTALIVTHRPGTALRCDEAILVDGGRIADRGSPAAILGGMGHRVGEAA